jgi:hypothetical protein
MVKDAQQRDAAGDRKVVRLPPRRPVGRNVTPSGIDEGPNQAARE